MPHYERMVNRQRKFMLYLLTAFILGWGFTNYQDIFLGLFLGTTVSFYNLWLLQKKIHVVGGAAAKNETAHALGTFSRFGSAALAIIIALRFPDYFHIVSVVIGLMTVYFVIIIDFIFHHKDYAFKEER
ncbi:ATP synthase subunit I [Salirhabdus salicampi]|uniref:ATP synthase subunit I n=1 Tax=Salirhabdus salicampi TaxID=476102 RepID=UPI0020C52CC4|nr:ATP synthase subunit I [Salirhabdus salicampi]MCP8617439.1 ATP synthase subunit I [Salirhabdus salicampi]